MKSDFDSLKKSWIKARETMGHSNIDVNAIVEKAKLRKRNSSQFHWGNIVILTITFIVLCYVMYNHLPFKDVLSKTGVWLMVAGLFIRILVEAASLYRALQIDISQHTLKNTDATIRFYKLRKIIHGPVTYLTVGMYSAGFYMLTPELLRHVSTAWIIFWDVFFVIGACILIFFIRKGIRKEIKELKEIVDMKSMLEAEA